ncbi:hypothetical protein MLD38_022104 [Melastoma candidum]|uniref:Uncharacterized protein n=2 Tax=Melastoma candidum TaxID=119954 RepID=A0ACB9QID1_9MYRT|nr:hypothetical protein MLD38_022104 [Melastoma candidum]
MEEGDGGSGDPIDQFHRNEAIAAVADDGILGEELEDDDYEDLYNDVNVGENFIQTMRNNNPGGGGGGEDAFQEKVVFDPPAHAAPLPRPQESNQGVIIPGVSGNGNSGGGVFGGDPVSRGYQDQGFRGNDGKGIVGSGPSVGRGGGGLRVELGQGSVKAESGQQVGGSRVDVGGVQGFGQNSNLGGVGGGAGSGGAGMGNMGNVVSLGNEGFGRQGGGGDMNGGNGLGHAPGNSNIVADPGAMGIMGSGGGANNVSGVGGGGGGGGTILFVGDLHWWTTDAELEAELCKYGHVKEVKFFDEKASGKSKGYCQVEFYDPVATATCKEGMNGHLFNGRPCVVAFASPYSVKRMGEAQVNRNQQMAQSSVGQSQTRRGPNEPPAKTSGNSIATGGNYQGGDNNRGYGGRGNWRGNAPGMTGRGPVGPRNRGAGMGGRGIMGNGGNGFGQGMGGTPPLLHPQSMMGQGFDPAFGGPMGRMGNYGGFPFVPAPPFTGMMSSFPPVGGVSLPGVAPHVNPAFFGRGMPMNAMGMMPTSGIEGPNMGMWSDPNMGGWGGEDHGGGRAGESSYGEEAASEHHYGEANHDRGNWPPGKEKDRNFEKDWSGSSERRYRDDKESAHEREMPRDVDVARDSEWSDRRHRDDRDVGRDRERERSRDRERDRDRDRDRERDRDRDRHRDDRDRYADQHKHSQHDDDLERGRSSRTHSKSRAPPEDDHRSRSRDADYGKRRRLTSE